MALVCAADLAIEPGRFPLSAVESWRGEILCWVRPGSGNRIERCKIKDPSLNWPMRPWLSAAHRWKAHRRALRLACRLHGCGKRVTVLAAGACSITARQSGLHEGSPSSRSFLYRFRSLIPSILAAFPR
jgi:hypothetical protein